MEGKRIHYIVSGWVVVLRTLSGGAASVVFGAGDEDVPAPNFGVRRL